LDIFRKIENETKANGPNLGGGPTAHDVARPTSLQPTPNDDKVAPEESTYAHAGVRNGGGSASRGIVMMGTRKQRGASSISQWTRRWWLISN
jgi:hypothetical protein